MAETHIIDPLSHESDNLDLSIGSVDDNEFSQPDYPELQDLAQSLIDVGNEFGFGGEFDAGSQVAMAPISLDLADLLTDESGALVLTGDSPIELHATQNVVEKGVVQDHLQVGGEDVNGFSFMVFDHGPTLYFPSGLEIAVSVGDPVV